MRSKYFTLLVLSFFIVASLAMKVSAVDCTPKVSLVSQDPVYAIPGEYVDVVFQVSDISTSACKDGVSFELIPSYPFSITDGTAERVLDSNTWSSQNQNAAWTIPYTLRVDKSALDGQSEIEVKYRTLSKDVYVTEKFNITITDYRTNFDAVIQEATSSEVSIAIANIGKYTANSVVVRIPEQDYYTVSGTDGQMVGNLDSGDYTIVGFTVTKNPRAARNLTSRGTPLAFDIYYTDNIGERRVQRMTLNVLDSGGSTNFTAGGMGGGFAGRGAYAQQAQSHWYSSVWTWIIAALVVIGGVFYVKKNPQLMDKFKKQKAKESKGQIPDWMAKARNKEKR